MKKPLFLIGLIFVLMIPAGLFGLMSSTAGSRWLIETLFSSLTAQISARAIEGRLLERITVSDLTYKSDTETVAINKLVFAWQPSKLFSGTLKIVDLTVNDLNVNVAETNAPTKESAFDLNAEILLPVDIVLENLLLTDIRFQQGEQLQQLDKLHLSAYTEQGQLHIVSLDANTKQMTATAKGRIVLGKGFPMDLTADWGGKTEAYGLWQATATINGDSRRLTFDNQVFSPFKLTVKGSLDNLPDPPNSKITLRGDWQKLNWPLSSIKPQVSSEQGYFEVAGLLNDYRINLIGTLTRPSMPKSDLTFFGKGGLDALSIEELKLKSAAGVFLVDGDISWADEIIFDLAANGQQFNPALLIPELPGSLKLNTRIKGKLAGEALQVDADINNLQGKLRGYPVSADGKLQWADELLKVDKFSLVLGVNHIAVNGTLGQQQSALAIAIDAPALQSFWPNFGGSLQADGHVHGPWINPEVQLKANGKRMFFAQHRADQLAIDIDYHADTKKTSKIHLIAAGIKTGTMQITKLLLDGSGTLEQHRFTADIRSSYGDISGLLTGGSKNRVWQGDFSRLDLNAPDFGRWQLTKNLTVHLAQSQGGIDAAWTKACLTQQAAAVCSQGRYPANGDFQVNVNATAIPTGLMQAYFPENFRLNGLINADADIHRLKNLLNGDYRLSMSAAKIVLEDYHRSTEYVLGASTISGKLKGTLVSADFDLALAAQDYLRGQLQLDTGKKQAISGRISASVRDFTLLRPFVPQLSDVQGILKADLALQGTIKKPLVNGTLDINHGVVEMAAQGLAFRDVNLQAVASGKSNNRVQLQGSTLLTASVKPDAVAQLELKTMMNINADLQRQAGLLSGHYRIDVPSDKSIILKGKERLTKIPLREFYLSGSINGKIISSDLNLALAAQDYLNADLQLDTGETQALSGHVKASVAEFALLNPFVPQLSNIKGDLKAQLTINGSAGKPAINGVIDLAEGSFDYSEFGLGIREIKLQALAANAGNSTPIKLNGSAKSGQGSIKLDGIAKWPGTAELMLTGTDFEVAKLPEAEIAVSPELKLVFAKPDGKVTGQLKIPKAVLKLRQLPENAVKVSRDEIILGEEKTKQNDAVVTNIDADIDVELGKQVSFSGQGLETSLTGRLKIIKTAEKMVMHGNVDMDKARYKSYGQDLAVRKGRFLFNGPVDKPWLDVEAIRVSNSKEVTAILKLSGPLDSPQTRLSSEPALPESEVLAYLVTGKPLNQVSKSEGNALAGAALSYGSGQISWIAEKLGVDVFEVKEGKTLQDTLVSVGQYLTPDFYVGTKVGLFNKQAVLVLKHKLTNTFNVETQTGTSQRIKLNYEIDKN